MKQVHLNRWEKKKKREILLLKQDKQKHHYLHRLFCHIARVPPAAACSHTTTMPLNREVSDRHHPPRWPFTPPTLQLPDHPVSTSPLALHHYELRHERFRLTFNPICVYFCNMIHFSDFIRFLLENVNDWTRCQLSKTLWPCKGRFVIQVFILFCT